MDVFPIQYSIMTEWGLILCLQKDDGSDSIAVQLADEAHWKDLVIIIAVVCVYLIYFPHDLLHILLIVMWLQ